MYIKHRFSKFWLTYFCVRIFYLFFDVFLYNRFSHLGDTSRYLQGGIGDENGSPLINSTFLMDTIGGILGNLSGGNELLANLPFTIISFYCVYWSITILKISRYINKYLLFVLISLPNFCIWTSVFSKETFGLIFSSILGVLYINFLKGDFKIRFRDLFALYLCIVFKAQYLPFILIGLAYIYLCKKFIKSPYQQMIFGVLIMSIAIVVLYVIRDIVDALALQMYAHFDFPGSSTRENIFTQPGDFYRVAPIGIFIAFVGPTFNEMFASPLALIAGIEGIAIIGIFLMLTSRFLIRIFSKLRVNPIPFFSIMFTTIGILFIHYPFGIFNMGSAIRYRTNFIYFFILLFIYLYISFKSIPPEHRKLQHIINPNN